MASQDDASDVTQDSPKRLAQTTFKNFSPKIRKPCMDAKSYKRLFIRREVQVFKSQGNQELQEPRKVVHVVKVQGDQGFQEEVGQNF